MRGERAPRVSVVIVNYNTRELLLSCLRSLKRSTEDLQIVVVDNASQDGSPEAVRTAFPEVQLLALPENRGFCRGNNIGIERSCGKYVLILNPDTEVETSALTLMADFMDHNPEYDGCTGQLHHPKFSGGTQLTCSRIPTFRFLLLQSSALGSWLRGRRRKLWQDYNYGGWSRESDADVEVVPGSCFMMRRGTFRYDERFFLYFGEESFFAQRLKAGRGWRLRYLSTARVLHHESSSTRSRFARRIFFRDCATYIRLHFGRFAWALWWVCALPLRLWLEMRPRR